MKHAQSARICGGDRGKLEDTAALFAYVGDRDGDKNKFGSEFVAPTITVETSPGNAHHWYALDRALAAKDAQNFGVAIRATLGADNNSANPTQPYRVAGTPNYPSKAKRERGRVEAHPTSYSNGGPVYQAEYLWSVVGGERAEPTPRTDNSVHYSTRADSPIIAPYIEYGLKHIPEGADRSALFCEIVSEAKYCGMSVDVIETLCRRHPEGCAQKYLEPRDRLRAEIARVWEKVIIEYGETIIINSGSQCGDEWFDTGSDAWNNPDLSLVEDQRGDLPEFPVDAFASAFARTWLERASRGAGVNLDQVAVPLLAVASGLVGTSRRVRASSSWSQPLTLWTAIVGYSGSGKTPGRTYPSGSSIKSTVTASLRSTNSSANMRPAFRSPRPQGSSGRMRSKKRLRPATPRPSCPRWPRCLQRL